MSSVRPPSPPNIRTLIHTAGYLGFHGPKQEAPISDLKNPGPAYPPAPAAGSYFDEHFYRDQLDHYFSVPDKVTPIWESGQGIDMQIFVSDKFVVPDLKSGKNRVFDEKNIKTGDWTEGRSVSVEVPLPESTKNNGTLFAHVFVGRHGKTLDPRDQEYNTGDAYYFSKMLTRFMPKKKVVKTKKLIGGSEEVEVEEEPVKEVEEKGPVIASYYHANLTLDMVVDNGVLQYGALPYPLRQHVVLEQSGARDKSGQNGWYYPIVYDNEFWLLKDHMVEINSTVSYVPRKFLCVWVC